MPRIRGGVRRRGGGAAETRRASAPAPAADCRWRGRRGHSPRSYGWWRAWPLSCNADRRHVPGHIGEHFGNMADLDPSTSAMELARNVQQAAEISGQHRLRTGPSDVDFLIADHLVGDVGVLDAEGASEAAADLSSGEFRQAEPADRLEQPARLVP